MKHNINKSSLYVTAVKSFCRGLAARAVALVERVIPVGYEDETGFHIRA